VKLSTKEDSVSTNADPDDGFVEFDEADELVQQAWNRFAASESDPPEEGVVSLPRIRRRNWQNVISFGVGDSVE
jgi:hypothetical protein